MSIENTTGAGSPESLPTPTRWLVAVHEAAHAHLQGVAVSGVTVEGIVAEENGAEREPGTSYGHCRPDWDGESEGARIGTDADGGPILLDW